GSGPWKKLDTLTFDGRDLDLFTAARHDRNPLHLSEDYARKTPYGERVVFGILAALGAMGQLSPRPGWELANLRADFRNPLFGGVPYRVELDESQTEEARISISDGERLMSIVRLTFRPGAGRLEDGLHGRPVAARAEPADRLLADIQEGLTVSGVYAPSAGPVAQLFHRWELGDKGIARQQLHGLLWSSYLVGMELPGKRALFWSLDIHFEPGAFSSGSPIAYRAEIARSNLQLQFVELRANLEIEGLPLARAKMRAFVRQDSPALSAHALEALLPASNRLLGKTAVVVGGSRGLGAAVVGALASQGCRVLGTYLRSADEAEHVRATSPERIQMIQGDASDELWCRNVLAAYDKLDILVCSAAPPIRPLGFSLSEVGRFRDFADRTLGLMAVPLATFVPVLSERAGWAVVISSSYVSTKPAEWPHYVTAKSAVEGLVQWAAARYPQMSFLLARPPKLLTDQTNAPGARVDAMPVERAAAGIVRRLCLSRQPSRGAPELLELF
ncbi:MAG: SDR family NAD(P)-dependent oxidoreductase, partial [Chloroflexota bacterium]|nr:SDR family NAD(P)-dependent oxidoreductase [Chloroflexota bacterium]